VSLASFFNHPSKVLLLAARHQQVHGALQILLACTQLLLMYQYYYMLPGTGVPVLLSAPGALLVYQYY